MPPCTVAIVILGFVSAFAVDGLGLKDRSCKCLNWAEVYENKGVVCGQALEFLFTRASAGAQRASTVMVASDSRLAAMRATPLGQLCKNFFERYSGNQCVGQMRDLRPADADKWYSGSWCYVSADCQDLRGGAKVPGTVVSWKGCEKGKDVALRDLTPDELIDVSAENDLDASKLFEYAYYSKEKDPHKVTERELDTVRVTKLPTVLKPVQANSPRILVYGRQVWSLEEDVLYKDPDHPGTFWRWSALGGHGHDL